MPIYTFPVDRSNIRGVRVVALVCFTACIYFIRNYQIVSETIQYDLDQTAEYEEMLDERRALEEKYKRSYDLDKTNEESAKARIASLMPEIQKSSQMLQEKGEKLHELEEKQYNYNQDYSQKEELLTDLRNIVVGMREKISGYRDNLLLGQERISYLENEIKEIKEKQHQEQLQQQLLLQQQQQQQQMNIQAADQQQPLLLPIDSQIQEQQPVQIIKPE